MSIKYIWQAFRSAGWSTYWGVFVAFWAFLVLAGVAGLFRAPNTFLSDVTATLFETPLRSDDVVVIALDAPSFQNVSQPWPWPRRLYAQMLESIQAAGARAIVFDIVFDQTTPDDEAFAEAIRRSGNVFLASERAITDTPYGKLESLSLPADPLLAAARGVGVASVHPDADGRLRRMPQAGDSLAFVIAGALGDEAAPPASNAPAFIRYADRDAGTRTVSFYQALEAERFLPPDALRDKIAVVGLSLEASPDAGNRVAGRIAVPFHAATGGSMNAVMVQAQILQNVLSQRALHPAPAMILVCFWAAALTSATFICKRTVRSPGSTAAWLALCIAGLLLLLGFARMGGWVLNGAAPIFGLAASGGGALGWASWIAFRERRRLADGFGRYVSADIMHRLLAEPDALKLGGDMREVSAVVTDLEGFTRMMQALPAEQSTQILRHYLDRLGQIVMAHGGMIDQFIGDSIIALFNAPSRQADHASRALACAVALAEAGEFFRLEYLGRGIEFGHTRVGADTGEAMVGNFGTEERFHYTALGEVMNTASRLEGANKTLGTVLTISARLFEAAAQPDGFVTAGKLLVPGAQEAIDALIYLPGLAEEEAALCRRLLSGLKVGGLDVAKEIEALEAGAVPGSASATAFAGLGRLARGEVLVTSK